MLDVARAGWKECLAQELVDERDEFEEPELVEEG
ncbi:hypothetical protein A2U01_0103573, partial [Trifolium medium]|nr:hypothetical protein [Trifolium medium]